MCGSAEPQFTSGTDRISQKHHNKSTTVDFPPFYLRKEKYRNMPEKYRHSPERIEGLSREFEGRALTLLGEILQQIQNQGLFLEKAFHVPDNYSNQDRDREEMDEESEDEM